MKRVVCMSLVVTMMWFYNVAFGQPLVVDTLTPPSVVVMAEEDISSLVKLLVKYKKEKSEGLALKVDANILPKAVAESDLLLENEDLKLRLSLLQNQLMQQRGAQVTQSHGTVQPDYRSQDISLLQRDMARMQNQLLELSRRKESQQVVVVPPASLLPPEKVVVSDTKDRDSVLVDLQNRSDSLLSNPENKGQKTLLENSYNAGELDSMQLQIAALTMALNAKEPRSDHYALLKAQPRDFRKVFFFDHNSTVLSSEGHLLVNQLVEWLRSNETLDLVLIGYASNRGGAGYNEQLSMQRTEAVKKAVLLNGISSFRVWTQYNGIDYGAASEAQGRRVEAVLRERL